MKDNESVSSIHIYRIYMDLQSAKNSRRKWARSICDIRVPIAVPFWDEKALSDPPKHQALAKSGATIAEENASDSAMQIDSVDQTWPAVDVFNILEQVFLNIGDKCLFEARHGKLIGPKAGAGPSKSESAFLSGSACHAIHRYGSIPHSFFNVLHLKFNYHLLCASVPATYMENAKNRRHYPLQMFKYEHCWARFAAGCGLASAELVSTYKQNPRRAWVSVSHHAFSILNRLHGQVNLGQDALSWSRQGHRERG